MLSPRINEREMTKWRIGHRRMLASLISILGGAIACTPAVETSVRAATGPHLVVQNFYYALPGKAREVYEWRLHASEVRAKLGLRRGRVLRRSPDPAGAPAADSPDVIWECEYPNAETRAREIARLSDSTEFKEVEDHMDTLIRDFRSTQFVVDGPDKPEL
jgi:hypothetical protein